ncbi:MAG TPA: NUDIX domain-containing protein [Acidimicrobiales bacterium]|nr:NUDIX domain-containing protein [Acidimicrobiales bacterium]
MAATSARSKAQVALNAVIISVDGTTPRLLTVQRGRAGAVGLPAEGLPTGQLDDAVDRTLEQAVRRLVSSELGLPVRYFEQLYTFGDRERVPGGRSVAVAYLALARHQVVRGPGSPHWRSYYDLFPWEDWRGGRPDVLDAVVGPALQRWLKSSAPEHVATRTERAELTFGIGHALWDPVRVLDRYELLYELKLVAEARGAGAAGPAGPPGAGLGAPLALDHRRIAAAALERLRGKLAYRPVVFEVLPETFTLSVLQQVVEALAGQVLHKQNFRRLVATANLVEPTGETELRTGGRPAEVYRFRREVLRERPAPGMGLRRLGGP